MTRQAVGFFEKMKDKIKKLADNHHFHFIDVNDGLSDENGNLKKELTFDGAHLNPAGYQLVLENLKVYLEEYKIIQDEK